ncbi:MAG: RDD family protein [Gammaproteobacteria bacterium]|nr:RDD family protein [Gammaproteobacteria bacterium]
MIDRQVLAGRWRRLGATAVDAVLVPGLTVVLVMAFEIMEDPEDFTSMWWMWWVLLLAVASYLILNGHGLARSGQTLGKRLFGIAVVRADALEPASFWKLICVRAPFFPLLFVVVYPPFMVLPLLDLLPMFGKARRCLHDRVAATRVVRVTAISRKA